MAPAVVSPQVTRRTGHGAVRALAAGTTSRGRGRSGPDARRVGSWQRAQSVRPPRAKLPAVRVVVAAVARRRPSGEGQLTGGFPGWQRAAGPSRRGAPARGNAVRAWSNFTADQAAVAWQVSHVPSAPCCPRCGSAWHSAQAVEPKRKMLGPRRRAGGRSEPSAREAVAGPRGGRRRRARPGARPSAAGASARGPRPRSAPASKPATSWQDSQRPRVRPVRELARVPVRVAVRAGGCAHRPRPAGPVARVAGDRRVEAAQREARPVVVEARRCGTRCQPAVVVAGRAARRPGGPRADPCGSSRRSGRTCPRSACRHPPARGTPRRPPSRAGRSAGSACASGRSGPARCEPTRPCCGRSRTRRPCVPRAGRVARRAGLVRRALEAQRSARPRLVARRAGHGVVRARQREARSIVIERRRLPLPRVVAVGAGSGANCLWCGSAWHDVHAGSRPRNVRARFAPPRARPPIANPVRLVARLARQRGMPSRQREPRLRVVERSAAVLAPEDQLERAALVLDVAPLAADAVLLPRVQPLPGRRSAGPAPCGR